MILENGEKVHIIERRYFEKDLRRHFVGEIIKCTDTAIRLKGYVWVYEINKGTFIKKPEKKERVIYLGERLTINVLPQEVNIDEIKYEETPEGNLIVTDGKKFSLDINEFSGSR